MIRRRNAQDGESPVMPWWVKDWFTSETVAAMTRATRSLYFDLLQYQWLHGSLPTDTRVLASMTGEGHGAFLKLWRGCSTCFEAGPDGRLRNERVEKERKLDAEYRAKKVAAGLKGATNRWQNDGTAIDLPIPNGCPPSPSPSPSTSSSKKAAEPPLFGGSDSKPNRTRKEPSGPVHDFLRWWEAEYLAVAGTPYGAKWGKKCGQAKALLEIAGGDEAELRARATKLLRHPPEWIASGGWDLGTLESQWNKLATASKGSDSEPLDTRVVPPHLDIYAHKRKAAQ